MLVKITSIRKGVVYCKAYGHRLKIYSLDNQIKKGMVLDCFVIADETETFLQPTGAISTIEEWEKQESL